ncbi:MAG: hypothetical protein H6930_13710 [Rhodoferax sp.]|nr:hypothetical protein [Rhodoferax sp.]
MPLFAANPEIQEALTQAERSVAATGQALIQGVPEQVHAATRDLHDSAHALALVLRDIDGVSSMAAAVHERLVLVARDIAMQREALLRRSAAVQQSLHSLVPQTRSDTYSGALSRYARGGPGKAGAFRSF